MSDSEQDEQRQEYNRLIMNNEERTDDLKLEQNKVETALDEVQQYLHHDFQQLNQSDLHLNVDEQRENDQLQLKFQHYFHDFHEQVSHDSHTQLRNLDDEREELYQKRGHLS
ncbi:hypothetical protein [Bombilactobacillus thymidiniphilus]|uniref:Uncharacterized protein n=1 Tax=Bombilactobacillus thymidiniphilus TaxID=2923363 RepID=A0ABY4PBK3_9LACO|nr:hypothetical protein [Bombilactobacillus thymidiniphilus]UQS83057.1 hypothetical protein MOO47_04535 [Bombilactobacillus thymidiniphilus]